MKKILMLATLALLSHLVSFAVPAYPVRKTMKMADGTMITVTLKGDENMHYYQTDDGKPMRLVDDLLYPIGDAEFQKMVEVRDERVTSSNKRRAVRGKKRVAYQGEKRGLVILVNFSDNQFSVPSPRQTYEDYFNKEGYTEYGMTGSVSDYFKQQSYGAFKLKFDVVGPYQLKRSMKAYGAGAGDAHDIDPGAMIEEAVKMANEDVNFWDYDWDKDGEADQVFVIYAGYGENYGASSDCIWPHESSIIYKGVMLDGIRIGTYACSCELSGTSDTVIDGIGAACHEFSHCLGIMDHYDTKGDNFGMGSWDLMCSGSYNNRSRTPAAYTAYERWVSGWLEPTEINSMTQIDGMKPLVDSPEAYILYNEGNRNEYYLLENRQQKGFDAALYGHGLLVVHVDYNEGRWNGNSINVGDVQHMTLVAADDEYSEYYAASLEGDPFPGKNHVTALTDYSEPAAKLNNPNKDKSYLMHKAIECIEEDELGNVSMILCAEPLLTPVIKGASDITPTSFRLSWDAVPGATHYELYLDETGKKASVEDALILGEDFSSCYSKTAGFTDISKNLSGYLRGFSGSKLFTTPDLLRIGTGTATGTLMTPVFESLKTGDLTIVMKVKPFKAGTAVKGAVKITTNTPETRQSFELNFAEETTLVFRSYVSFMEIFRVDIEPASAMYISGLYLYDGSFSDAELGVKSASNAPHRIQVGSFNAFTNSYEFTDLKPECNYAVKIRAWDDLNRVSNWTELFQIVDPTSILAPSAVQQDDNYFDLQGRQVSSPSRGIYIHNGKKVLIK